MIKEITFNELTDYFKSLFDLKESSNQYIKYIGYFKDELIGFVSYSIIYDRAEIEYIAVYEQYRNKKIGSSLLEYVIEACKDCINITLEVNKNNIEAINLYKKYDFNIEAIRKNYYKDNDGYLMIKKLGD